MKPCMVYFTCNSRKGAVAISSRLVEEKLIACANIIDNVTSVYRWKDKIETDDEVIVVAKTMSDCIRNVTLVVKSMLSNELPCVVSYDIIDGYPDYLEWVKSETRRS